MGISSSDVDSSWSNHASREKGWVGVKILNRNNWEKGEERTMPVESPHLYLGYLNNLFISYIKESYIWSWSPVHV